MCFRAADEYSGNYTVWSHRCWLMEKFFPENKKVELELNEVSFANLLGQGRE